MVTVRFSPTCLLFSILLLPAITACAKPNSTESSNDVLRSHELNLLQAQRVIDAAQAEIDQINRRNSGRIALLQRCLDRIIVLQAFPSPPETPERIQTDATLLSAQQIALSLYQEIKTERPRLLELHQLVEERKAYQQRIRTIYFPEDQPAATSRSSPELYDFDAIQTRISELSKERTVFAGAADAFEQLRGELRWPASGKVVYPFGEFTHPQYDITIKNTGIDLRVETGAEIQAVAAGVVFFTEELPGLNRTVILDHGGGYMSVYGNILEQIEVDQSVEAGDLIGKAIGSTTSQYTVFHFALFKEEEPLNPVLWLKPE